MLSHYKKQLSEQRRKMLILLYEYRCLTARGLGKMIYHTDELTQSKKNILYRSLTKLDELGFIHRAPMPTAGYDHQFVYYLSEQGTELAKDILEIPAYYKGSGFQKDVGDFPYELVSPPQKQLNHFFIVQDVLMLAELMKTKYPALEIDSRDNRYASRPFPAAVRMRRAKVDVEKTIYLRPDAEIVLKDKVYFVEADTGSERGNHMRLKFQRYYQYFQHCKKQGYPLPEAIIMVTPSPMPRRFHSVASVFWMELKEFALEVNFIFCAQQELEKRLLHESQTTVLLAELVRLVDTHTAQRVYEGTELLEATQEHNLPFNGQVCFTITQQRPEHTLYVYSQMYGLETRGLLRAYALVDWVKQRKLTEQVLMPVQHVVPVIYSKGANPLGIRLDPEHPQHQVFGLFLSRALTLDIAKGTWKTLDTQMPVEGHPLLVR